MPRLILRPCFATIEDFLALPSVPTMCMVGFTVCGDLAIGVREAQTGRHTRRARSFRCGDDLGEPVEVSEPIE